MFRTSIDIVVWFDILSFCRLGGGSTQGQDLFHKRRSLLSAEAERDDIFIELEGPSDPKKAF